MPQLYIQKNPNPQTLISKVYSNAQPDGYEIATEQEVSDWVHTQIVAGWEPTFPDLPIEEQKVIVERQRNTYREQSLFLKSQVETLQAEKATLTTEKATLTEQLSEKTTLADSQDTTITTLTTQLQEATEAKEVLFIKKLAVDSDLVEANAKIAFLESIRTYDPNQIRSLAFYDRITKDQINKLGLLAIDDPQAAEIHKLLNAYKNNPWPVLLDDPLVVGGIQYLLHIAIITEQEAAQITRPASREEAYIAS